MISYSDHVERTIHGPPYELYEEMKYEANRLLSYRLWPHFSPTSRIMLAREGFHYTGRGDEVRCFSCGVVKDNWNRITSIAVEHRNLSPNCRHQNRIDESNVPIYVPPVEDLERVRINFLSSSDIASDSAAENTNILPVLPEHLESIEDMLRKAPERLLHSIQITDFSQDVLPSTPSLTTSAGATASDARQVPHGANVSPAPVLEYHNQYRLERKRLDSYENWPPGAHVRPRELARAGFYYTSSGDRVQCAFCSGILRNWEAGDNAMEEHRSHFPTCNFAQGFDCGNVPVSMSENTVEDTLNDPTLGIIRDRPHNPRYAIESIRVTSFRGWPTNKQQTPQILSKAGFFYAGFGDNVKCFYCDGGLRNWEPGDDPWVEHARWLPKCAYLKQCKGEDFIKRIQRNELSPANTNQNQQSDNTGLGAESHDVEAREVRARMDTPAVQTVLEMRYPRDSIKEVLKKRLEETGMDFPSVASLVDALEDEGIEALEVNEPSFGTGDISLPESEETQSVIKENKELKEQRMCKICMDEEVSIVFLPCGHLVCCPSCAPSMSKCPICRTNIRGSVRTYMA